MYVQDDLVSIIIAMVSENTELHAYCVQRLYVALSEDISKQPLCKVAVWTIGEFGDLIVSAPNALDKEQKDVRLCACVYIAVYLFVSICLFVCLFCLFVCLFQVTEDEVLDVIERVLQSPQSSLTTREYSINAVMKLSTR